MARGRGWLVAAFLWACGPTDVREHGEDIDLEREVPDAGARPPGAAFGFCDETTACVLGPSLRGEVRLQTAADVDAIQGVRCIYGPLTIEGSELSDLTGLDALEVVCGVATIRDNPRLTDVTGLGALTVLPRLEIRENPVLETIELPTLESGELSISHNTALSKIELASFASGSLAVIENANLTRVGPLPSFEVGSLFSNANPRLVEIEATRLREGSISSVSDATLARVSAPALSAATLLEIADAGTLVALEVPGLVTLDTLVVSRSPAFTDVPVLAGISEIGRVELLDNPAIVSLSGLEALNAVDSLEILGNASLDQSYAEEVAAALGGGKVAGNAGWVVPSDCPFEDGVCDAAGCGGTEVCGEGSDVLDCCVCLGVDCPAGRGS